MTPASSDDRPAVRAAHAAEDAAKAAELAAGRQDRPRLRGRLHLIGAVMVVLAAPWLFTAVAADARWTAVVFVVGVFLMLATSAAYHVVNWPTHLLPVWRRADHSMIFVGIAATYTPYLWVALEGGARTWFLVGVWAGAVVGIIVNQVFHHAPSWVRMVPYLVLGWVSVVLIPSLQQVDWTVLWLVVAGGLAYTVGGVVYALRRPNPSPRWFGHHEVFHLLTLIALACHWAGIHLALT